MAATTEMQAIHDAIHEDAAAAELAALPLPATMRACVIRKEDEHVFDGVPEEEQDPSRTLHLDEVPIPPLGPGEALIAPMASALNYNTVWSARFAPVSTFRFLERFGRGSELGARHDLDHHILGSDAAGVVLRTGPGVTQWKPGDRVVVHCNYVDLEDPAGHMDSMLDPGQRIWGFETNFGALADISMVKANQLLPMPDHLDWEEAASLGLTLATAYRMLVSPNGAQMKQGDVVLIWGGTGGLGGFASQLVLNGGGVPVAVVSSQAKAEQLRAIGVEHIIDRKAEGYRFIDDDDVIDESELRRFGKRIRELVGQDPDIVFEHPGRTTFPASVYVCKRGGIVVTCASTTGYKHVYDNRVLWMRLKRIIGSHFANYAEAWEANRLVDLGMLQPILTETFPLADIGDAALKMHRNEHTGKLGVLVGAREEGLGVRDTEQRAGLEDRIKLFRDLA